MWYAFLVNLRLKYRSRTVDLARLKPTCTVNAGQVRRVVLGREPGDPSKGHGGSPAPPALRRRGGRNPKEAETLRPLPVLLALAAAGSLVMALVPSSNGARCARRAVALGVVAVYAWMVV
jgi:hypothetical protein